MNALTEDEAESRINREDNLVNRIKIFRESKKTGRKRGDSNPNGGRTEGATNLDDFTRSIIGTCSAISGATEASKAFDVSRQTAHNLKDGIVGNETAPNGTREITVSPNAVNKVKRNLDEIAEKGSAFLIKTLDLLDQRIDSVGKPRELASIGRDVASMVEKALPRDNTPPGPGVVFQFLVPQPKKESEFEVIDVTSKSV